jgi:hypothetical protein
LNKSKFMLIIWAALTIYATSALAENKNNFSTPFLATGDISSFIYFKQNSSFFIDSEVGIELKVLRYKRFSFSPYFAEETYMGRKYHSNMVFDPNRGHWIFGFVGRLEFTRYFIEARIRHECFHDIGRWLEIDYSVFWNTIGLGLGSIGYLAENKYHQANYETAGVSWPKKFDYYFLSSFFAPKGASWQKNQNYNLNLNTNFRFAVVRYRRLEFDMESNNLFTLDADNHYERRHGLNFDITFYGDHGAMITYIGWWPYDTVRVRTRDKKAVFGLHLAF